MKKIIYCSLLIILSWIVLDTQVSATEEIPEGFEESYGIDDGTIEWRLHLWEETENYPDRVSYVILYDDGETYGVGLVENNEQNQEAFLDWVPNSTEQIVFHEAEYSWNEQRETLEEIVNDYFPEDDQIYTASIEMDRVVVEVDPEIYSDYLLLFQEEFGNIVEVQQGQPVEPVSTFESSDDWSGSEDSDFEISNESEEGYELFDQEADGLEQGDEAVEEFVDEPMLTNEDLDTDSGTLQTSLYYVNEQPGSPFLHPPMIVLYVLLLGGALYFIHKGVIGRRQVAEGIEGQERTITKEEVETQIRESRFEPSEEMYQSILEEWKKNEKE